MSHRIGACTQHSIIIVAAVTMATATVRSDRVRMYHGRNVICSSFMFAVVSIIASRSSQSSLAFQSTRITRKTVSSFKVSSSADDSTRRASKNDDDDQQPQPAGIQSLNDILTARLPTSVEDQVRQARAALSVSPHHRHVIRLLLPVIGATELDDWPGGSRQQMEAAYPLVKSILNRPIQNTFLIDDSDGVTALMAQGTTAADDACAVVLPTAECMASVIQPNLDGQVGPTRDLILFNPQYRRRSDFGRAWFGRDDATADYAETFYPTFSLTNLVCEGESIRILRAHPSPWRVFRRDERVENGEVDWVEIGQKPFLDVKPTDWNNQPDNKRDGGLLFNYGQPSYQEIAVMLTNAPDYKAKNPAERAAVAFNFIKDSL
jgi:hypothetical protein